MKRYTLGFVFDASQQNVLLIHKTHPDWQKGKVNGVGGKIDEGEDPAACVAREVAEETGLHLPEEKWKKIALLAGTDWEMFVFVSVYEGDKQDAVSKTEEKVEWFSVDDLPKNVISNVNWMLPLCEDMFNGGDTEGEIIDVKVLYN